MKFDFLTDNESQAFCEKIVRAMGILYDIKEESACDLLNKSWRHYDWRDPLKGGLDENYFLLYHESVHDWASRIGNPRPIVDDPARDDWRIREEDAERRLCEISESGNHDWL